MTKHFMSDSPSIDEIMSVRKPRTEELWLPLDNDVLAEITEVEQLLAKARRDDERLNRVPQAPRLQERLDELHEAAAEAAVRFVCRELPRKQYRDLIEAHPPVKEGRRWNDETFGPALIAARVHRAGHPAGSGAGAVGHLERLRHQRPVRRCDHGQRGAVEDPFWREELRRDRRLRAELDYCVPRGIGHSDFLTWPDDDQDKALAWLEDKNERCAGCGQPRSIAWGDENAHRWVGDQTTCHACAAAESQAHLVREGEGSVAGVKTFPVPS